MKKALITGAGGFVGGYLCQYLLSLNYRLTGIVHPKHTSNKLDSKKIRVIASDLSKKAQIVKILQTYKPDFIFHLAAFASPAKSFKSPVETLENNIGAQLNLLEAAKEIKSAAWILIVGTAEEYGNVEAKYLPVNEEVPLAPTSPYAVSKVAQDLLGYQYFLHHSLNIVRVRPFNHIGPGQSKDFVVGAFASQIAQIEEKGKGAIKVGNLETERDFTDVRDIVKAYRLALSGKCKSGEVYNIGSGKAVKISDILKKLISMSTAKIKIVKDKKLFRPVEIKISYCDFSKFNKATGWKPEIPLEKTLFDTMNFERNKLN